MIPKPTIARLCTLYRFLEDMQQKEITNISSSRIADQLGESSHSIRKDVSYLGEIISSGGGYDVDHLREVIAQKFGLNRQRRVCVVGLGDLGTSLLNFNKYQNSGYKIVAGFDSNVNKIETMKSEVDLYTTWAMADTIKRHHIELALITVPGSAAQGVVDKLVEAGIRGIINFTPAVVQSKKSQVFIRNIDILAEFNILAAMMTLTK